MDRRGDCRQSVPKAAAGLCLDAHWTSSMAERTAERMSEIVGWQW
jgi:hypothetical protein